MADQPKLTQPSKNNFPPGPKPTPENLRLADPEDALLWALRHIQQVDNHAFEVKRAPYLNAIFQDETPNLCVMKSSQTRLSVTMLSRFIHRVGTRGWNGIYYMPTDEVMIPFVQSRIDPLIRFNTGLNDLVKDTNSVTVKRIGNAFGYLFGLKSKSKRESFPADFEVFDELDQMGEKDVEMALQRLEASPYKYVDYISTPTLPGFGIDRKFQESDQKYWAMVCPHCGTWNHPEMLPFPACIENGFLACKHCGKALQNVGGKGEWVPKFPDRTMSGYHVSRLFSPDAVYTRILDQYRNLQDKQNFYNRVLGLPYADVQSRITKEQVLALCGGTAMQGSSVQPCYAGVDVGHDYLKVVIGRSSPNVLHEYVWVGTITGNTMDLWNRLRDLFVLFNVKRYVIDGEPETQATREFIEKIYKRDGWLADYVTGHSQLPPTWNDKTRVVKMDRTTSLDASFKLLRDAMVVFPRRCEAMEELAEHCANLQRMQEVDDTHGTVTYNWVHSESDPDHFRHAQSYEALTWYQGQAPFVTKGTFVVPKKIRQMLGEE